MSHYPDEDDLTISSVGRKRAVMPSYDVEEVDKQALLLQKKKEDLQLTIALVAVMVIMAIAMIAANFFLPPLGAFSISIAVGSIGVGIMLWLFIQYKLDQKKEENKKLHDVIIKLREIGNSTSSSQKDWYKGEATGKHLYHTEQTGPVDIAPTANL